ncbi:double zinc ribbon domain-containing protein [Haloglomus salinum]|uniref:double zinc ribbon domain-containing protein n=1 Tax=Haloglomus salinum TaxID=2962673 RepID=UPI0020C9F36C|nr:zinc ribbon domain-containing protein [Haloglomus salinum]
MSKITFRADDDLVAQLEEFDASKSEVMREALREYLGEPAGTSADTSDAAEVADAGTLDELVAERVDAIITDRLEGYRPPTESQDINVNISLDGESGASATTEGGERNTVPTEGANEAESGENPCAQCGEKLTQDHVYCPNCGEKASHRVFCECGDELRSDWAFCPSCGRRTTAADVLDSP